MVKPISLRLRHAEILAQARVALGSGREQELKQAHNTRVMERARGIVAQAKEQDRQRRRGKLAAVLVGNLRSEILVVQSTQNRHRQRETDSLDGTRDRRVLVQG
jgi:hypothetical protein